MAEANRDDTKTERTLTRYLNGILDFSIKAGEALTARDYKEVTLAYLNGKRIAEKASIPIAQIRETEHSNLCQEIKTAYTNLKGIYDTSIEIQASNRDDDDRTIEDMFRSDE